MMNMDDLHFVYSNNKSQFKFKEWIGPFIVNTRASSKEVDSMLKQIKFKLSFTWYYDPLGIIYILIAKPKDNSLCTYTKARNTTICQSRSV